MEVKGRQASFWARHQTKFIVVVGFGFLGFLVYVLLVSPFSGTWPHLQLS